MKPDKIKELVDRGADVNAPSMVGVLPLQFASALGQKDTVGFLLKHGAAAQGNASSLYSWILSLNPALDKTDDAYMQLTDSCTRSGGADTALHHAAFAGNLESVKQLLAWGADPRAQNSQGITATEAGRRMHRFDVVEFLEAAEADEAKGVLQPHSPSFIASKRLPSK